MTRSKLEKMALKIAREWCPEETLQEQAMEKGVVEGARAFAEAFITDCEAQLHPNAHDDGELRAAIRLMTEFLQKMEAPDGEEE